MEYGVVLPNLAHFGTPLPTHAELLNYARAARASGFTSAWAADHVMHAAPSLYAPAVLAAVATAIPDMRVGFASMPAFIRHPIATANLIATLELLTEGRLDVAFSIGDEHAEMAALGAARSQRGRRLDEVLTILTRIAAEPEVTYAGELFSFDCARVRPRPLQPPVAARLYVASWTGVAARERIVAHSLGWMASGLFSREAHLRSGMADLQSSATERGQPRVPTVITNVLTCISSDPAILERARGILRDEPTLQGLRGVRLVGPPAEVAETLALIRQIGFDRLNVLPVDFDVRQFEPFMRLV